MLGAVSQHRSVLSSSCCGWCSKLAYTHLYHLRRFREFSWISHQMCVAEKNLHDMRATLACMEHHWISSIVYSACYLFWKLWEQPLSKISGAVGCALRHGYIAMTLEGHAHDGHPYLILARETFMDCTPSILQVLELKGRCKLLWACQVISASGLC